MIKLKGKGTKPYAIKAPFPFVIKSPILRCCLSSWWNGINVTTSVPKGKDVSVTMANHAESKVDLTLPLHLVSGDMFNVGRNWLELASSPPS